RKYSLYSHTLSAAPPCFKKNTPVPTRHHPPLWFKNKRPMAAPVIPVRLQAIDRSYCRVEQCRGAPRLVPTLDRSHHRALVVDLSRQLPKSGGPARSFWVPEKQAPGDP